MRRIDKAKAWLLAHRQQPTADSAQPNRETSSPATLRGARHRGWLAQPPVARLLTRPDENTRQALLEFLQNASPRDWVLLDDAVRATLAYGRQASAPPGQDLLSTGLRSMARDGRLRETAIGQLARRPEPLAGPFLALRTQDWVPEVAAAATRALLQANAETLALAAPVMIQLSRRTRAELPLKTFTQAVGQSESAIRLLLGSRDGRARRLGLDLALESGMLTLPELASIARFDQDEQVAIASGLAALRAAAGSGDRGLMHELLRSGAKVRRAVLDALPIDDWSVSVAQDCLFDRSPIVRSGAQGLLLRANLNPAQIYRTTSAQPERRATCLLELGYLGGVGDRDLIAAGLRDPAPAVRRSAVLSLGRLVRADAVGEMTELLSDSVPGVVRASQRALRPFASAIDPQTLWQLTRDDQSYVRGAAYRLLRARTLVDRIESDLVAARDAEAALSDEARGDLRGWLQRKASSTPRPDGVARTRLATQLEASAGRLDRSVVEQLRFHLGLRPADLQ
jgi:hypothetical protein